MWAYSVVMLGYCSYVQTKRSKDYGAAVFGLLNITDPGNSPADSAASIVQSRAK